MINACKYRCIKTISILISILVPLSAFAMKLSDDNSCFTAGTQFNEVLHTNSGFRKIHNRNSEGKLELQKHDDICDFFITAFVSGTITYITSAGVKYLIKKIIPKKTKKEVINPYI